MNNMLKMALAGLCLIIPALGQIVIDWYDIPMVNYTNWNKNIAYNATVNLGASGGPQTWTFTSQPMGNDSCWNIVIPSSYAPFLDSFPTANLFYATVDGPDSACLYMHLDPTYIATLGFAGQDSSGGVFQKYIVIDTNFLPDQYGNNRHYRTTWRYQIDASTYIEYTKRGYESINAYGTVVIPFNSFPCLRYLLMDTVTSIIYYNNVPIIYDTVTKIGHQFVAENFSGVVCVFSQDNETNPYFTNAAILERLTRFIPGGAVSENNPCAKQLEIAVRPNPFSAQTNISIEHGEKNRELRIYDISGKLIKELSSELGSGIIDHVSWNGTDQTGHQVPAGVYFIQVESDMKAFTKKIVKTK